MLKTKSGSVMARREGYIGGALAWPAFDDVLINPVIFGPGNIIFSMQCEIPFVRAHQGGHGLGRVMAQRTLYK